MSQDHLGRAIGFWRQAIKTREREGLPGFGWFAEVEQLGSNVWADLTLQTLRHSGGRLDWAHRVAERAIQMPVSKTTLALMNELIRGSIDEWDRRRTTELAVTLIAAATKLDGTIEYQRLRTTLLERGAM